MLKEIERQIDEIQEKIDDNIKEMLLAEKIINKKDTVDVIAKKIIKNGYELTKESLKNKPEITTYFLRKNEEAISSFAVITDLDLEKGKVLIRMTPIIYLKK